MAETEQVPESLTRRFNMSRTIRFFLAITIGVGGPALLFMGVVTVAMMFMDIYAGGYIHQGLTIIPATASEMYPAMYRMLYLICMSAVPAILLFAFHWNAMIHLLFGIPTDDIHGWLRGSGDDGWLRGSGDDLPTTCRKYPEHIDGLEREISQLTLKLNETRSDLRVVRDLLADPHSCEPGTHSVAEDQCTLEATHG